MQNISSSSNLPETFARCEDGGATYALLIGVDRYATTSQLYCSKNDVDLFYDCLVRDVGVDSRKIVRLCSNDPALGMQPFHHIIDNWIDFQLRNLKENDKLIVMFSGHGFEVDEVSYLAPADLIVNLNSEYDTKTAVSFKELTERLNKCPAGVKWLIIDACRVKVEQAKGGSLRAFGTGGLPLPEGSVIFQSCQSGEVSIEDIKEGHGLFIQTLVAALQGEADYNKDGVITLGDLERYVTEETPKAAKLIQCEQTPCCYFKSSKLKGFVASDKTEGLFHRQIIEGEKLVSEARQLIDEAKILRKTSDASRVVVPLENAREKVQTALNLKPDSSGSYHRNWTELFDSIQKDLLIIELKNEIKRLQGQPFQTNSQYPANPSLNGQSSGTTPQHVVKPSSCESDQSIKIGDAVYTFRYCPTGSFLMGSPDDESGHMDSETQHKEIISHSYWILETQVTQRLWKSVIGEKKNPSFFKGDDLPVEQVSWNDCLEFLDVLNKSAFAPTGMKFRLPTEAQWEYSCRSGEMGAYALRLEEAGWFNLNSLGRTHDVKTQLPNKWGIYDMHGNVWEWCQNCPYDYGSNTVTNPDLRALRGGSWAMPSERCRSAARFSNVPNFRVYTVGFRIIMCKDE